MQKKQLILLNLRICIPKNIISLTKCNIDLQQKLDLKQTDLLIAITWNKDRTDVDLHVIEPSGEECYYENQTTRSGGSITRDVTQGFGPEMYTLQNAESGAYKIRVKYFRADASRASTRTKVAVTVIEGWGT